MDLQNKFSNKLKKVLSDIGIEEGSLLCVLFVASVDNIEATCEDDFIEKFIKQYVVLKLKTLLDEAIRKEDIWEYKIEKL